MKTEIFENYSAFLKREDKTVNGVGPEFAKANPDYAQERNNKGCWNSSSCSYCSGKPGDRLRGLEKVKGDEKGTDNKPWIVPVINNMHQKVLDAVSMPEAFDMGGWHKDTATNEQGAYCGTTHCWAGWIVALGGKEGKELEERTNTLFAALQINKASSAIRISPMYFYTKNEEAMAEIKRCAEEESKITN